MVINSSSSSSISICSVYAVIVTSLLFEFWLPCSVKQWKINEVGSLKLFRWASNVKLAGQKCPKLTILQANICKYFNHSCFIYCLYFEIGSAFQRHDRISGRMEEMKWRMKSLQLNLHKYFSPFFIILALFCCLILTGCPHHTAKNLPCPILTITVKTWGTFSSCIYITWSCKTSSLGSFINPWLNVTEYSAAKTSRHTVYPQLFVQA